MWFAVEGRWSDVGVCLAEFGCDLWPRSRIHLRGDAAQLASFFLPGSFRHWRSPSCPKTSFSPAL